MLKKILFTVLALGLINTTIKAQCPTVVLGPPQTICQGDTVQISGNVPASGTTVWTVKLPAPLVIPPFPPLTTTPTIIPLPSPVTFVANDSTPTVKLTAGAQSPVASQTQPPPSQQTYRLYYTITAAGCPVSKDSVNLVVNPAPTASVVATGGSVNQTNCTGGTTFTVTAVAPTGGSTGIWSKVSGAGTIANPSGPATAVTGVTSVTVLKWTVTNGTCSASRTVTLTAGSPPTAANAGVDKNGCVGDTLQLLGSIATSGTPRWTNSSAAAGLGGIGGFPITLPTLAKSITFLPNGNNDSVKVKLDTVGTFKLYYTISVGTSSACSSRDSMNIVVTDCKAIGIDDNANSGLSISLQPNPASGSVLLSLKDSNTSNAEVSIISLDGRTVSSEQLGSVKDIVKTINISNLSSGIYFVRVKKGGDIYSTKLVVQ